jgi:hypothetical protein
MRYSRFASEIMVPIFFTTSLSAQALIDGELWFVSSSPYYPFHPFRLLSAILPQHRQLVTSLRFGRGNGFREAQRLSFAKTETGSSTPTWEYLRLIAFDHPQQIVPFEFRFETLLVQRECHAVILSSGSTD